MAKEYSVFVIYDKNITIVPNNKITKRLFLSSNIFGFLDKIIPTNAPIKTNCKYGNNGNNDPNWDVKYEAKKIFAELFHSIELTSGELTNMIIVNIKKEIIGFTFIFEVKNVTIIISNNPTPIM